MGNELENWLLFTRNRFSFLLIILKELGSGFNLMFWPSPRVLDYNHETFMKECLSVRACFTTIEVERTIIQTAMG